MAFNKGRDTTWLMHCRIIKPRRSAGKCKVLFFFFSGTGIKYKYPPAAGINLWLDCSVSWSLFQHESCVCLLDWLQGRQTSTLVITAIKQSRYHRQGLTYKDFKRPQLKSKIITIAPEEHFEFRTSLQLEDKCLLRTGSITKALQHAKSHFTCFFPSLRIPV